MEPEKMPEKKKLKIKIFDKEYSLLVDDEEIAKELLSRDKIVQRSGF